MTPLYRVRMFGNEYLKNEQLIEDLVVEKEKTADARRYVYGIVRPIRVPDYVSSVCTVCLPT